MAGSPLGASPAPFSPPAFPVVLTTRSRRLHTAFCLGTEIARVWSTRRADDARGVVLSIGEGGPLALTGRFTSDQARRIARALNDAAAALELGAGQVGGAQ